MGISFDRNVAEALTMLAAEDGVDAQDIVRLAVAEHIRQRIKARAAVVEDVRTEAHAGVPVRTGAHGDAPESGPETPSKATRAVRTDAHRGVPVRTDAHRGVPGRTGAHDEAAPPPPLHPSTPLSISLPQPGETDREEVQEEGGGAPLAKSAPPDSKQDREVFEVWCASLPGGGAGYLLNAKRREKLKARRREGYTQEQLLDAVRGWPFDPWEDRAGHNDLAVLLRDGGQVEKFARLYRERNSAPTGRPPILAPGSSPQLLAEAADLDRQLEAAP